MLVAFGCFSPKHVDGLITLEYSENICADLFPLELGDQNLVFIVLGGVILAGIIVVLILTMMRRTSAMSNEISAQSKIRFEAITPTTPTSPSHEQATEVREKLRPPTSTERTQETGSYLALRKDLLELKLQLDRYIRESAPTIETQRETISDVEKLKGEITGLRDRLTAEGQEMQRIKASLADQGIKLHSQRRDIEAQRSEIEKIRAQPEAEKLKVEIAAFKDRLLAIEEKLEKLRASPPRQMIDLQPVRAPDILERLGSTMPRSTSIVQPTTQGEPQALLNERPSPLGLLSGNCRNCGSALHIEDRFCIRCGQPIA